MRLNKKYCKIGGLAIAICALTWLLVWWLMPKNYADVIPSQAKAVVRIVPSELTKSSLKDINPLEQTLGIKADGIDLNSPLYAFITPNEYIGFTAKVKDQDAITAQIDKLVKQKKCSPIEEIDGQQWVWINAGWLATWTNNTLLVLGPGVAQERDVLRQTMTAMMHSDDSFTSTDKFNELKSLQGAMQLFAQLDALPTPYNLLFRLAIPPECDPSAVHLFATIKSENKGNTANYTTIESNVTSDNEDIEQAIKTFEKHKSCISFPEETLQSASAPLFVLSTCTQGKPLLQLLKTDATLRGLLMGLNQTFDADKMLSSTNGLFSIEIDSLSKDFTPTYCMKAETTADHLFDNADYWIASAAKQKNVTLKRISPLSFMLKNEHQQLNFGYHTANAALYFASSSMLAKASQPFLAQKTNDKEGLLVYFHLNLAKLFQQPCFKNNSTSNLIQMLLPGSKQITYKAYTGGKSILKIE